MKKFKSFVVIAIVGLMFWASMPTVFAWAPPAKGALTIKSFPTGADVYVDGELQPLKTNISFYSTKCIINNLTIGSSYLIKVEKAGFVPVTKIFKIGGSLQGYTFVLKPLPNILVAAYPAGATLYVEGQKWAATAPCIIPSVIPGESYTLRIEKTGYLPMEKKVIANAGTKVVVFNLQKYKAAQLLIKSFPSGASVYVNGNFVGLTPYTGAMASAQEISLKVTKQGYLTQTKSVYLGNGSQYFWQVGLKVSIIPE